MWWAAEIKGATKMAVALTSGVIAGVASAIISHPADTLLSKVNKAGAGGEGSIMTRLGRIAGEIGFVKLATVGLGARCVMIGTLTAGQFLVFDIVMDLTGASKFHFHDPKADRELPIHRRTFGCLILVRRASFSFFVRF